MDKISAIVPRTKPTPTPMRVPCISKGSLGAGAGLGIAKGGTTSVVVVIGVMVVPPGTDNVGALRVSTFTEKVWELDDEIPFVTAVVRALLFVVANKLWMSAALPAPLVGAFAGIVIL